MLEAAAAGHRSGGDDVAGVELLARRGVGEHRAERVLRVGGRALAPQLAVDAHAAALGGPVGNGVGGDHVEADRVGEGLGLDHRAEDVAAGVVGLHVARAPVVQHEPAADRVDRLLGRRVDERPGQHAGQLQLEVQVLRVRRPPHVLAVGDHRRVVGDVEGRSLAEAVVRPELGERLAGDALEARHGLGHRSREEVLDEHPARVDDVLLPEHERAHRARPEGQDRLGRIGRLGAGQARPTCRPSARNPSRSPS